jgi:hypothetical protein
MDDDFYPMGGSWQEEVAPMEDIVEPAEQMRMALAMSDDYMRPDLLAVIRIGLTENARIEAQLSALLTEAEQAKMQDGQQRLVIADLEAQLSAVRGLIEKWKRLGETPVGTTAPNPIFTRHADELQAALDGEG